MESSMYRQRLWAYHYPYMVRPAVQEEVRCLDAVRLVTEQGYNQSESTPSP